MHVGLVLNVAGSGVKARMVGPLVENMHFDRLFDPLADHILRNDRRAEAGDQLVDAVVDFRIYVIGPSRKDNDLPALLPGSRDDLLAAHPRSTSLRARLGM